MTDATESRSAALQPLRAALLDHAHAEAHRIRAAAEEEGQQALAAARSAAAALLGGARDQGIADAAAVIDLQRAKLRRTVRDVVLAAHRDVYDDLRQRARAAVRSSLSEPVRRGRLAEMLRARLGTESTVRDHPDGGLIAQTPDGRSVDASVEALVAGALADLDLEQLWAPT